MAKKKTKNRKLEEAVAEAVGAGVTHQIETVDFADPHRPKTCLEIDFPILPVNRVSSIEAASGAAKKPIYQCSKWWARRQSSVFRTILLAAASKAPVKIDDAAKTVWSVYYGNHQTNPAFRELRVGDVFMGGGTTIAEAARLGMQAFGNDLNPVAWLINRAIFNSVEPRDVSIALESIEKLVKPQIMPYYACRCPLGHTGKWTKRATGETMTDAFDPLSLEFAERQDYEYVGPEVIYTFWAKHGSCQATECNHITPIMTSPVIAQKTVSVKAWLEHECTACGQSYDIEHKAVRLAPNALYVVAGGEKPHCVIDEAGRYECPHCHESSHDAKAAIDGRSSSLGKAKSKKVALTLLIHPEWLRGDPDRGENGVKFGGRVTDDAQSTAAWNTRRASSLRLIEFRGPLPEQIECPDTEQSFFTDNRGGTVPKKATLECKAATCGRQHDISDLIADSGSIAPAAAYVEHVFCPTCKKNGSATNGRYFAAATDTHRLNKAAEEWESRSQHDLVSYWPTSKVGEGLETSVRTPLQKYHYRYWYEFFNGRQLLCHALLMKTISEGVEGQRFSSEVRMALLTAFQLYLRYNCMFTIWHKRNNQISAFLSNNNVQPKNNTVETSVFSAVGEGSWRSASAAMVTALNWKNAPWELVSKAEMSMVDPDLANEFKGKSVKVDTGDPLNGTVCVECNSATDMANSDDKSFDLIVTDPPFGDIVQYSELSEFFYAWLRLPLASEVPCFQPEHIPVALEAVENQYRHKGDSSSFYKRVLTACWREVFRSLKDGGILAFTFHHDKDGPWVSVLESLFDAGFYLEAAFPIRSDETKGEGSKPGTYGAQKVEYDIIHVCRKRTEEPAEISWARLRRQIMRDVRQIEDLLHRHEEAGLQQADLQVIRRGKALEHFSRHYGKVYVERGREFTVKEALVGINSLLDDERDTSSEAPPVNAEPFTRQFLRLFANQTNLPRDQVQKYLRGTGVSSADFQNRGWCSEKKKVFYLTQPPEFAKQWKGQSRSGMSRDMDQALFLLGACYENSGIRVHDTLNSAVFKPHPAIGDILDWFIRHGGDSEMKQAAQTAKQLYTTWESKNKPKVDAQLRLFDENDMED